MKLSKYLKVYWLPATVGFIFKIAEAFLELMVPLVMADIIDIGIKNNDKNYILMKGLVLVALAIIGYLFALVCQYPSLEVLTMKVWKFIRQTIKCQ